MGPEHPATSGITARDADLPAAMLGLLDGVRLERGVGFVLQLLTADEDGWPRSSLLSVGEVIATGTRTLRLALWPGTRSTATLTRTGRATLACVVDGTVYTARLSATRAPDIRIGDHELAVFDARVVDLRADTVSYARVTSGITFTLPDESRVLARWHEQVAALRGPVHR